MAEIELHEPYCRTVEKGRFFFFNMFSYTHGFTMGLTIDYKSVILHRVQNRHRKCRIYSLFFALISLFKSYSIHRIITYWEDYEMKMEVKLNAFNINKRISHQTFITNGINRMMWTLVFEHRLAIED